MSNALLANDPEANADAVFLASAARTTTQTQGDQTNDYRKGIRVVIDITSAGTGSITVSIDAKDLASGKYVPILATAALTTNQTKTMLVYPGAAAVANGSVNDRLPKTWRILVTANNANAMTYSVGTQLLA
jgi:YbbR domain-containing protein